MSKTRIVLGDTVMKVKDNTRVRGVVLVCCSSVKFVVDAGWLLVLVPQRIAKCCDHKSQHFATCLHLLLLMDGHRGVQFISLSISA